MNQNTAEKIILALLAGLLLAGPCGAAVLVVPFGETGLTASIPDNNASGLARSVQVSGLANLAPYEVTVSLRITGTGFGAVNGDYYADLRHLSADGVMTQLAVLLNRVGRTASDSLGYDDNGFDVTLKDSAPYDIHNYRLALGGNPSTPLPSALTGTWQADGRNVNPFSSVDSSLRSTTLNILGQNDPNGTWTLFVADLAAGGTGQLTDWQVLLQPIPEPSPCFLQGMAGVVWLILRRKKRTLFEA